MYKPKKKGAIMYKISIINDKNPSLIDDARSWNLINPYHYINKELQPFTFNDGMETSY